MFLKVYFVQRILIVDFSVVSLFLEIGSLFGFCIKFGKNLCLYGFCDWYIYFYKNICYC